MVIYANVRPIYLIYINYKMSLWLLFGHFKVLIYIDYLGTCLHETACDEGFARVR